jgi:hypothetical protein
MQLMIRNSDQKILNAGIPPWSNQAEYAAGTYTIVEIGDQPIPTDKPILMHFYRNNVFVYDSTSDNEAATNLSAIKVLVTGLAGKPFVDLTASELRLVFGYFLHKFGALDSQRRLKHPNDWMK